MTKKSTWEVWDYLCKFGIYPCSEDSRLEIDSHTIYSWKESLYFDCLKLVEDSHHDSEYIQAHGIFADLDETGMVGLWMSKISFPHPLGLGAVADVEKVKEKIKQTMSSFYVEPQH